MEVFIEDLFEEAAPLIYPAASPNELNMLFSQTSERLNHPSIQKVTVLYFSIGMNHPLSQIRWKKMSNAAFQRNYAEFLNRRGQVAHGRQPPIRLQTLRGWKNMVENFSQRLEALTATHIENQTGVRPAW
jgi:hypothetical protein